jgi:hypothetical protein
MSSSSNSLSERTEASPAPPDPTELRPFSNLTLASQLPSIFPALNCEASSKNPPRCLPYDAGSHTWKHTQLTLQQGPVLLLLYNNMSVEGHHHHVVAVDLDNKVATEADIAAAALLTQQLRQELLQLERDLEVAVAEENEAKIAFELQSYEMNQSKDALRDNDEIMELLEEAKQLPRPSNITDLEVSKKFPLQMNLFC